jgi:protein-histidine pros-kinase
MALVPVRGAVAARDAEGRPSRVLMLQRDISEVKAAEAALISAKEAADRPTGRAAPSWPI